MATYNSGVNNIDSLLGGTLTLTAGAGVTSATLNIVGVLTTFDITAPSDGTLIINNEVAVGSTYNIHTNGSAVTLNSTGLGAAVGALGAVNATIDGGSFTIGANLITASILSAGSITFAAPGGTSVVGTSGSFVTLDLLTALSPYQGFTSSADIIDARSLNFSDFSSYTISDNTPGNNSVQTIVIDDSNGTSFSFETNGSALTIGTYTSLTAGPLQLTADGSLGTDITVCFLRGSRILGADGEVAVEDVRVGDMVATRQNGETVFKPVTWVGHRAIDVAAVGGHRDAYPVRIRANAFAANVPARDLLITSEHCVLVSGKLVPIRMLVNGGSIVIDTGITSYEYFHIELENHAILLAEGLTVESYLDTGNRRNFANTPVPAMRPDFAVAASHKSWKTDAAAPLAVDPQTVEPIWRDLAERSIALNAAPMVIETTDEPDLTVSIKGRSIRPIYAADGLFIFALPKGTTQVQLMSRASAPADTQPWLNDRRRLGVNVRQIVVRGATEYLDVPLDSPGLSEGWWDIERAGATAHRWTDGAAVLALPALQRSMALLELQLDGGMTYVADATGRSSHAA